MQVAGPMVVVDDDVDDQLFLRNIINDLGIENELLFFSNGTDFLVYLKSTADKPFLILSDINMHQAMSGLEIRAEIQKDICLRRKSIPFLFFTTSQGKSITERVYDLQVQGYFIKGSSYAEMKAQIGLIIQYWLNNVQPGTA